MLYFQENTKTNIMEEKNKKGNKDPKTIKKKLNKYKVNPKKGKNIPKNKKKSGPKKAAQKPGKPVRKNVGVSAKNPISIDQPQVQGGYIMNIGDKEIDSPTNFKTKDAMLMMQSPMGMHIPGDPKKGHDPKKKRKVLETKITTGEKGGFVTKSEGPVTGGVVNTLDEVIITNVLDPNKKQPKSSKSSKLTKKPKVKSIYKKRLQVNAPVIGFGPGNRQARVQNRSGRTGIGKLIASINPFENQWQIESNFLGYNKKFNPLVEKVYKRRTPKQIKRMKKRGVIFTKKKK
jgi:hypothetical protein